MNASMEQPVATQTPGAQAPGVLRVVEGLHQGASVALRDSGLAIIGSADDCDLILVDVGVAARHAAITVHERDVTLRAIDGQLEVNGRSIVPGEVTTLVAGTPIVIGGAKIVIGGDEPEAVATGSAPSQEAHDAASSDGDPADQSGSSSGAANGRSSPGGTDADGSQPAGAQPSQTAASSKLNRLQKVMDTYAPWMRTSRGRKWSAVGFGLCIAGALFAVSVTLPAKIAARGGTPEQRAEKLLTAMKLAGEVKVSSPEPGVLALTGTAPDQATHSELVRRLDAEGLAPVLRVAIGAQLASAVKDVFRVNGFNVDAKYSSGGVVLITGVGEGNRRVAPVVEHAMRDIQGLSAIRFGVGGRTVVSRADMAPQSGPISVGAKRVVSVVDGDPAYIVTSDGARYFVGATLPEGHRVLAISNGSVILERDGERVVMTF